MAAGGGNVPLGEKKWILVWDLDETLVHNDASNNPSILNHKAIQFLNDARTSDSVAYIFLLTNNPTYKYIEEAITNIKNYISSLNTYPSNSIGLDEANTKSIPIFDAIKYDHVYNKEVTYNFDDDAHIKITERIQGIPANNFRYVMGNTMYHYFIHDDTRFRNDYKRLIPTKSWNDITHLIKMADINTNKSDQNINTIDELGKTYKIMFFDDLPNHKLTRQIQKNSLQGIFHRIPKMVGAQFVPEDFLKEYAALGIDLASSNNAGAAGGGAAGGAERKQVGASRRKRKSQNRKNKKPTKKLTKKPRSK